MCQSRPPLSATLWRWTSALSNHSSPARPACLSQTRPTPSATALHLWENTLAKRDKMCLHHFPLLIFHSSCLSSYWTAGWSTPVSWIFGPCRVLCLREKDHVEKRPRLCGLPATACSMWLQEPQEVAAIHPREPTAAFLHPTTAQHASWEEKRPWRIFAWPLRPPWGLQWDPSLHFSHTHFQKMTTPMVQWTTTVMSWVAVAWEPIPSTCQHFWLSLVSTFWKIHFNFCMDKMDTYVWRKIGDNCNAKVSFDLFAWLIADVSLPLPTANQANLMSSVLFLYGLLEVLKSICLSFSFWLEPRKRNYCCWIVQ